MGPRVELKEALRTAGEAVVKLVEQGQLVEAARVLFEKALAPLFELVRQNAEQIARLSEVDARLGKRIEQLSAKIEEVDVRLGEAIERLSESVRRLTGEVGRLKGWKVEIKVARMLADWFKRRAPDYDVIWWAGPGADVLIEGKGILAAVDIAATPKVEDVHQLKQGVGAIRTAWGRRPDPLIIYSHSGVVPDDVAELAKREGVRLARGPRELKAILDEAAVGNA